MLLWVLVPSSAATVTLGQTGDAATVDVPLVRGMGDTRPRVAVHLAEDARPVLGILDLGGDEVRIGSLMAARLGLHARHGRVALDQLRIGEVLVEGVTAITTRTDELVVGVGALPDLGVAVLPSQGMVRFASDIDALLASVGTPIPVVAGTSTKWRERGSVVTGPVDDAVPATLVGTERAEALLRLRSDRAETTIGAGVLDGDEVRRVVGPAVRAAIELPGVSVPSRLLARDEAIADPRPDVIGELGADGLAFLDVAVGAGRIAFAEAVDPRWDDAAAVRRGWLEAEAPEWDAVHARKAWAELAELRWATGDTEGALAADAQLEPLVDDRCELFLAIGIRRLRAGAPGADEALAQAESAYAIWEALGPEVRDRVRYGRRLPDGVSSTRQPVICEQAAVLRAGLPSSEAGLRRVGARTPLAALLLAHGRTEPALAWAREVAGTADPHPLTTALILGPQLVDADPSWVAGRLASMAWGRGPADVGELGVLHPGDASVACQIALSAALVGEGTIPDLPEADCLAASTLLALSRGDSEIAAVTRSVLHRRWPDLVPDVTDVVAVHTPPPEAP